MNTHGHLFGIREARKVKFRLSMGSLLAATSLLISLTTQNVSAAPFNIQPVPFPGAQGLITLVDYFFYAAWIIVALMLAYSAIMAHRGGHTSEGFRRSLEGVVIAAFILTFGWAILTGAL